MSSGAEIRGSMGRVRGGGPIGSTDQILCFEFGHRLGYGAIGRCSGVF